MKAAKILGLLLLGAALPALVCAEIVDPSLTTYTDPAVTTYADPAVTTYADPAVLTTTPTTPPTPPPTPTTTSYSTDIKAYGDQTASHSLGEMTVNSDDVTHTHFDNFSFDGTIDVMKGGGCTGAECSFGIAQGTFDIGTETGVSDVTTYVDLKNYTGSVDMSSYGGIAVCTTVPAAAFGTFDQYQSINQTIYGPGGSSSTYNGSQSLKLGATN